MIRTYNGNINRQSIYDLKKICAANAHDKETLKEECEKYGSIIVCSHLNPFTGLPDIFSPELTLCTEKDIEECVHDYFLERLEVYLKIHPTQKDPLLEALLSYVQKHFGCFPNKEEFKQMEIKAEEKRLSKSSQKTTILPPPITEQLLLREILEMAEEIFAVYSDTIPKARKEYDDFEYFPIQSGLKGAISHKILFPKNCFLDYTCMVEMAGEKKEPIFITITYYPNGNAYCYAEDILDQELDIPLTAKLITIHQTFLNMLQEYGISLKSEISNYQDITS